MRKINVIWMTGASLFLLLNPVFAQLDLTGYKIVDGAILSLEQRKLAAQAAPFAALSAAIYENQKNVEGWTRMEPAEKRSSVPIPVETRRMMVGPIFADPKVVKTTDSIGFHASTYTKGGEFVVVFEGAKSIVEDFLIAGYGQMEGDKVPQQFVLAKEYLEKTVKDNPTAKIAVTGHSLGGNLAQYAAAMVMKENKKDVAKNLEVFTFNSAGLYSSAATDVFGSIKGGRTLDKDDLSKFNHLMVEGEILGNKLLGLARGVLLGEQYKEPVKLPILLGLTPSEKHSIVGFEKALSNISADLKRDEDLVAAAKKAPPVTKILPATKVLPGTKPQYSELDNLSSADRPKVIDTTTNYIAGSAVFSPSSGLAYLGTATGFEMRRDAPNTLESYDLGSSGSGSRGTASIVDKGSDASAGNLNWGRWSGAGSTNVAAGITYTGQNFHYIFGSAPTEYLNRTDSVTYTPVTPVGGTNPTSSGGTNVAAGTAGTFNGGTIGVNFATRAVTVSNLNFTVSTATFNMGGSSTYNSNALFSGSMTGTCTGASCSGAVSGNHIGTLTGPAAAGIALGYQAHTTGTGMVVGAQGFKR